tara:strand:+ start:8771 stop:9283 length:513 start_codon:yes stop_codon:yes gene_type:complete
VVSAAFAAVGIFVFRRYLFTWEFKELFVLTAVIRCIGAVVDIIIINRYNIRYGIPDKVAFLLGNAMVRSAISAIEAMPLIALTSKLCPRGNEGSVYALLASFQNYGVAIATSLGSVATTVAGVSFEHTLCEYDNLVPLVAVSNILLPLAVIPFTALLPVGHMASLANELR